MQCRVKLPTKLCNDLDAMMARFWWGSKGERRKILWLSRDKLSEKKSDGGLGFKDLRCFNLAMLAKQGWRLMRGGDSLLRKVLKSKYYPLCTYMTATAPASASWTWKSILEDRKVLEGGVRWHVGRGSRVKAATDPWLPRSQSFQPRSIADFAKDFHVSEFIDGNSGKSKEELVREAFSQAEADIILGFPLPRGELRDKVIRHVAADGDNSVRSGYEVASNLTRNGLMGSRATGESSNREQRKEVWKSIWELPCQGKIKHFIWRDVCMILFQ